MALSNIESSALTACVLLAVFGVGSTFVHLQPRLSQVSIQGMDVRSEPIGPDQTIERDKDWFPPEDVFITGWNCILGAPGAAPTLMLSHGDVRLFQMSGAQGETASNSYGNGLGYRVNRGEHLRLRLTITNRGTAGETHGASCLLQFVPVHGY
jgi:hypothetical protein